MKIPMGYSSMTSFQTPVDLSGASAGHIGSFTTGGESRGFKRGFAKGWLLKKDSLW